MHPGTSGANLGRLILQVITLNNYPKAATRGFHVWINNDFNNRDGMKVAFFTHFKTAVLYLQETQFAQSAGMNIREEAFDA